MKKLISLSLLIIALAACEKVSEPYQATPYPSGRGPSETEYPVHNNTVICSSVKTKGPAIYAGRDELRYVQFGDPLYGDNYPDIEVTHKPAHVQVAFNKKNGVVSPDIWLENEYDDSGEDNYLDLTLTRKGISINKYHFTLKRAQVAFETNYVYEKDSAFVRLDGHFLESPSKNTSFIDRWPELFVFTIQSNTYCNLTISDDWISKFDYGRIQFSPNENFETRRGYIAVSDIYGEATDTIRFTQEGTGFKQRQYEVLMEFYNALDGPNWKYNNNWGDYDELYNPSGGWDNGWSGIGVNSKGYVTEISLTNNKLSGRLPESLGELRCLFSLKLNENSITGPIPAGIGKLGCLDTIDLSENQLTGNFPETMKNMYRLRSLAFEKNNLSGNIPDWMPSGLPRYPYSNMSYYMYNNYWRNYSHEKHCSGSYDYHDYEKYGKTPDGFEYGGGVEINF